MPLYLKLSALTLTSLAFITAQELKLMSSLHIYLCQLSGLLFIRIYLHYADVGLEWQTVLSLAHPDTENAILNSSC